MGCFEDYMQFRDEVDEVKKKIQGQGASNNCLSREDLEKKENDIAEPQVRA